MSYKAAVFDLDGTIADTIPITVYSLKKAIYDFTGKAAADEDILAEFGPVDTEIIKAFVNPGDAEKAAERYVEYFKNEFETMVKPIEGMKELISFIKSKDIKIGLFTGRGERVSKIILEKLGLHEYFQVMITGNDTSKPKPDPEGIFLALQKLGTNPEESIYTGDFDVDIMASKNAGVTSVLALWSTTGDEKLLVHKPDKYFTSPFQFIEWLK